ncbi:hypothetical protein KAH27_05890 [bacterium]|nr:hypothetical protein [bacterium]
MISRHDKKSIIDAVQVILKGHEEIVFAYLFGSFIEEEVFNDLDIAIFLNAAKILNKSPFYEIELSNQIEEVINIPTDIILLNTAPDYIINRVSKGRIIKNAADNKRVEFITNHWKLYWDFNNKIQEHVLELKHGYR